MDCKNCGNKIPSNSSFCTNCGKKVEGLNEGKPSQASVNQNFNQMNHAKRNKEHVQPLYSNKGKKEKNTLRSLFVFLMISSGVLLIASIVFLLSNMDNRQDIDSVFQEGPKIDKEVFESWDKDEYSLASIVNEVLGEDVASLGTSQAKQGINNFDDIDKTEENKTSLASIFDWVKWMKTRVTYIN